MMPGILVCVGQDDLYGASLNPTESWMGGLPENLTRHALPISSVTLGSLPLPEDGVVYMPEKPPGLEAPRVLNASETASALGVLSRAARALSASFAVRRYNLDTEISPHCQLSLSNHATQLRFIVDDMRSGVVDELEQYRGSCLDSCLFEPVSSLVQEVERKVETAEGIAGNGDGEWNDKTRGAAKEAEEWIVMAKGAEGWVCACQEELDSILGHAISKLKQVNRRTQLGAIAS